MSSTEAPISLSIKSTTGYDAPLLTIRAETPQSFALALGAFSAPAGQAASSGDLLLAVNLVAAEFSAKADLAFGTAAVVTSQGEVPVQQPAPAQAPATQDPWAQGAAPGYNAQQAPTQQEPYGQPYNQAPAQRSFGENAAAPSNHAPTPIGDKSGIPLKYREGTGANGPYWAYMSGQGRDTPPNQKDKAVFLKAPLPDDHPDKIAFLNGGRGRR